MKIIAIAFASLLVASTIIGQTADHYPGPWDFSARTRITDSMHLIGKETHQSPMPPKFILPITDLAQNGPIDTLPVPPPPVKESKADAPAPTPPAEKPKEKCRPAEYPPGTQVKVPDVPTPAPTTSTLAPAGKPKALWPFTPTPATPTPPGPTPAPVPDIPADLAAAMRAVELNRQQLGVHQGQKTQAEADLKLANEAIGKDNTKMATDLAAAQKIWNSLYGPPVPPEPVLAVIGITGSAATLSVGGSCQYTAKGADQNGVVLIKQPTFTWSTTGGTITSGGLYTAPDTPGSYNITAASGDVSKTVNIDVTPPPVPVVSNMRVLVSYDPTAQLEEAQWNIVTSPDIRKYLEKHCPRENGKRTKVVNGYYTTEEFNSPCYRFYATTTDASGDTAVWTPLENDIKTKTQPWIRAWDSNSKMVIDQTLPSSVADTFALLQKYGGK